MGKSTTASFLAKRGIPIADTDSIARELVAPGMPALVEIRREFGDTLIDSRGNLDRKKLAQIVFSDPGARAALETILHPLIRVEWQHRVQKWKEAQLPVAAAVIPLLFETAAACYFDAIVCVACGKPTQYSRLAERGWNYEAMARRIAAQMPVDEKINRADYVVWSDTTLAVHQGQVDEIVANVAPLSKGREFESSSQR